MTLADDRLIDPEDVPARPEGPEARRRGRHDTICLDASVVAAERDCLSEAEGEGKITIDVGNAATIDDLPSRNPAPMAGRRSRARGTG